MKKLDIINRNTYLANQVSSQVIDLCSKILTILTIHPKLFFTACDSIQMEYYKADSSYLELEVFADKIVVLLMPTHKYVDSDQFIIRPNDYSQLKTITQQFLK